MSVFHAVLCLCSMLNCICVPCCVVSVFHAGYLSRMSLRDSPEAVDKKGGSGQRCSVDQGVKSNVLPLQCMLCMQVGPGGQLHQTEGPQRGHLPVHRHLRVRANLTTVAVTSEGCRGVYVRVCYCYSQHS